MDYIIGFVYLDEVEPKVRYVRAEDMDDEKAAIDWAKERFTPIDIVSIKEVQTGLSIPIIKRM